MVIEYRNNSQQQLLACQCFDWDVVLSYIKSISLNNPHWNSSKKSNLLHIYIYFYLPFYKLLSKSKGNFLVLGLLRVLNLNGLPLPPLLVFKLLLLLLPSPTLLPVGLVAPWKVKLMLLALTSLPFFISSSSSWFLEWLWWLLRKGDAILMDDILIQKFKKSERIEQM